MNTFGEMIKLGDLPEEQKAEIKDLILYSMEHEGEFYTETNKEPLDANKTSMTYTRSYLPEIDKTSDRYKNGLVEGETPEPEKINEADFTVTVTENGWYYNYTNKLMNHSYRPMKERFTKFLGNLSKSYHDEKIADAYLRSANVVTDIDLFDLEDLLKLADILYVNGARPFGEFYKLKVAPEVATKMLVTYKDLFTHTTQKENIVKGEIGEIGGFRVIKSKLQAFKVGSDGKSKFIAYGTNDKGRYPVTQVAYDDMNGKIIVKPLGSNGNDPLNQRGSIGFYLDGHGFFVEDDSAVVRGEVSGVTAVTAFDNANRSNLISSTIAASNIYPDVTVFELAKDATRTLAITDENNKTLTGCTFESTNTDIATVSEEGLVTGVKQGTARIVISKGNAVCVVSVNVVPKA